MINQEYYHYLLQQYGREIADNYSNVCANMTNTKSTKKKGKQPKNLPSERTSRTAPRYRWGKLDLTAKQWAEALEIHPATFLKRIQKNGFCKETFQEPKHYWNTRNADKVTWDGITLNRRQWAIRLGISPNTMGIRLKRYGICEKTFTPAKYKHCYEKKITWEGETLNITGWAKKLGLSTATFYQRLQNYGICEKIFCPIYSMDKHRLITWRGQTRTTTEWAKKLGISQPAFTQRLRTHGICAKTFIPLRQSGNKLPSIEWQGETCTTTEWAKKLGISPVTFKQRLQKYGICEKTFTQGKLPLHPMETPTVASHHVLSSGLSES